MRVNCTDKHQFQIMFGRGRVGKRKLIEATNTSKKSFVIQKNGKMKAPPVPEGKNKEEKVSCSRCGLE